MDRHIVEVMSGSKELEDLLEKINKGEITRANLSEYGHIHRTIDCGATFYSMSNNAYYTAIGAMSEYQTRIDRAHLRDGMTDLELLQYPSWSEPVCNELIFRGFFKKNGLGRIISKYAHHRSIKVLRNKLKNRRTTPADRYLIQLHIDEIEQHEEYLDRVRRSITKGGLLWRKGWSEKRIRDTGLEPFARFKTQYGGTRLHYDIDQILGVERSTVGGVFYELPALPKAIDEFAFNLQTEIDLITSRLYSDFVDLNKSDGLKSTDDENKKARKKRSSKVIRLEPIGWTK